jgi:DNA-binding MarR family transcriptional regulator
MSIQRLSQPQNLDDLFLYALSRLLASAGGRVIRLCEGEFGITRREWRFLALLAESDGILSSALAASAQLDRARTSRTLSGLVTKQLITRTPRTNDRRKVAIHLTPQGRALHDALFPRIVEINQELLSVLDPGQVQALDTMLVSLQTRANTMAQDRSGPAADRRRGGRARPALG